MSDEKSGDGEKVSKFSGEMVKHGSGVNSKRAFPTNRVTVKNVEEIYLTSDGEFRVVSVQGKPHNQLIRQKGP